MPYILLPALIYSRPLTRSLQVLVYLEIQPGLLSVLSAHECTQLGRERLQSVAALEIPQVFDHLALTAI